MAKEPKAPGELSNLEKQLQAAHSIWGPKKEGEIMNTHFIRPEPSEQSRRPRKRADRTAENG